MPPESTFDVDSFISQEIEGAMSTKYVPVPENDYTGILDDDFSIREVQANSGPTPVLDLTWIILDDELQEVMGMDRVTVRQSIFIDVEPNGAMASGPNKNIKLARLREALGQNDPKKSWNFHMLKGAGPCLIKVIQRPDKNDSTIIYNDVSRVTTMP